MNLLQIGSDISRGIGQANEYQLLRQRNYDANLGMNHFFSTLTSFQLIGTAFSKINLIIKNVKFAEISPIPTYITFSISALIPCALIYIKKSINLTSHPNIRILTNALDYQILPDVILIANLVASIGLIAFGNFLYGGCNLTFLLLHLLDEQGWVNADFTQKNPFFTNTLLLCEVNYLITSLNLYNALSLLNVVTTILYKARYYKKNITNTIRTITLEEFEKKCSKSFSLPYRLSNYHLLKKPASINPIENLEDQFDKYNASLSNYLKQDLSLYRSTLLSIFREDEKWQNDHYHDDNSLDYLNKGIKGLLSYMRKVTTQKELKNKFLSLIKHMPNLSTEEQISLLARLAQTGHYCPQRKYDDIMLLYDTYIDTIEKRDLPNKILDILHEDRKQILDQFLNFLNEIKSNLTAEVNKPERAQDRLFTAKAQLVASLIPSFEDVYFANIIKKLLSPYLYVHYTSIDALTEYRMSIIEKWFFNIILTEIIRTAKEKFADQYKPPVILTRIMDSINNESIIAFNEMQKWFIDKYRNSFPEATSEKATTWMHKYVYNVDTGLIKPPYLLFFLINQGVLELIENKRDIEEDTARISLSSHKRYVSSS